MIRRVGDGTGKIFINERTTTARFTSGVVSSSTDLPIPASRHCVPR